MLLLGSKKKVNPRAILLQIVLLLQNNYLLGLQVAYRLLFKLFIPVTYTLVTDT